MNRQEIEEKLLQNKKYFYEKFFNWYNHKQVYGFDMIQSSFVIGFTDYLDNFEYEDWCDLLGLDYEDIEENNRIIKYAKEIVDEQYDDWFDNNYLDFNLENYSE